MKRSILMTISHGCLFAVLMAAWFAGASVASAQVGPGGGTPAIVDCTGTITNSDGNPPYPSINAFLHSLGPFDYTVVVNGTCTENITISNGDNFYLVGGHINGNVKIVDSPDGVYLKGVTISNSNSDGIDISKSKVVLDSCDVNHNGGNGVTIADASNVEVNGGSYDDNQADGFFVTKHSFLNFDSQVEIRRNQQSGIQIGQADLSTSGNLQISESVNGPGVDLLGGAHAQFGNVAGPNIVENNKNGGISVRENSELSLWTCCTQLPNLVRKNAKFGISVGFHSQVTLAGAEVSGNGGPGIDVYANSQLTFFPGTTNRVIANGAQLPGFPPLSGPSPGVRVNGNSQAWLHAGEISNNPSGNQVPGIRVVINSSVDLAGLDFGLNAGGSSGPVTSNGITCDLTSIAVSDLTLGFPTGCIGGGRLQPY